MIPEKRTRIGALTAIAVTLLLVTAVVVGSGLTDDDAPTEPTSEASVLPALQPPTPQTDSPRSTPSSATAAKHLSEAFVDIARTVTPAVVRIQTERRIANPHANLPQDRFHDFFGQPRKDDDGPDLFPDITGGSGFIVSRDGVILTNNHVVHGAEKITVSLWDKRTYDGELVGGDPTTDVAVVRIHAKNLPTVQLGNSDATDVGQWVLAIGNPGFQDMSTLDFTVTSGILSAKGRPLNVIRDELQAERNPAASYAIEDFLQTDAVINPGNSGGPLVGLGGEVIGINTAIASQTGYYQGYGFAIPINVARRVMRDILEHGHVRRALLGISITDVSPEDAQVYSLPSIAGVLVQDFSEGSPAEKAGVKRQDVIVGVNGEPVGRVAQLQRIIAQNSPGTRVHLDLIRYGRQVSVTVPLMEAPVVAAEKADPAAKPAPRGPSGLGLEFANLTPTMARQYGFDDAEGVVITRVEPTGSAFLKGVLPRYRVVEVDRKEVHNARQVRSILDRLHSGDVASFLLRDPRGGTFVANVRVP
ncbi:MAG: trypsin-like peptidase domain-containing protein [Gemmatimonadota bacterium]